MTLDQGGVQMTSSITRVALLVLTVSAAAATAQDQPEPPPGGAAPQTQPQPPKDPREIDPREILLDEIDRLHGVVDALHRELAQARLDAAESNRQLRELRQFIRDHDALGRDFEQYQAVKAVADRDARRRAAEAARDRREAEQADRYARRRAAQADRERGRAEFNRLKRYRDAGFTALGFDVFLGNASFFYQTTDGTPARVDYDGRIGHYLRLYPYAGGGRIDYSSMTVSGSVLNAAEDVRNIGVAVAFFDENGNQVGGEIIQINNARPDVPYPFTATIAMALDRPFTSSTTYVLYADPVGAGAPAPGRQ